MTKRLLTHLYVWIDVLFDAAEKKFVDNFSNVDIVDECKSMFSSKIDN